MNELRRTTAPAGGAQCEPVPAPIAAEHLGSAGITPTGAFAAGSYATFTVVYTAGTYGIDDSGSLRICFRFATDQTKPQFTDPEAPGYTTVWASNNAVLEYRYDPKGNTRPWDQTLYVKVVNGYLKEGDTISVRFGDTSGGSPGMRLQTFCEDTFEFRVLVDPIATCTYQALPDQPVIAIVPGPPESWVAILPSLRRVGEPFSLKLKSEDRWGNPSDKADRTLHLRAIGPLDGLPETVAFRPGMFTAEIPGLRAAAAGDIAVELRDENGEVLARSTPLRVVEEAELVHFWGDLHGQTEETIGTGSARGYFEFARDKAFLDMTAHQGNDFQMTNEFWEDLNGITRDFNDDGRFVTLPGYEWSGNTFLGGDRNVFFAEEGRRIRRSSHAMLPEQDDIDTDVTTAEALFAALAEHGEDAVCYAHCGGRYADIVRAHDGRFERSVEIHSSWGSFEWLAHDAFRLGHRVGIVGNSDGHKGRPGASYPGASQFGAIGGLTCFLMPELTRPALIRSQRQRRHYATTGTRLFIDLRAELPEGSTLYHDDPALGPAQGVAAREALMGDIVRCAADSVRLRVDILASAPIEKLEIYDAMDRLETIRPYGPDELGRRIRVIWEGALYRGRFRQVVWDGEAQFNGNSVERASAVNFFNRDKSLDRVAADRLRWRALTTGNFGGFDAWLADRDKGTLALTTPLVAEEVAIADIGYDDIVFDASAALPRFVRVFRLPDDNPHRTMTIERTLPLRPEGDTRIYVKLTQEDGHVAWTSPVYLFR